MLTLILAPLAMAALPDGRRLHADQACYAIVGPAATGKAVLGATAQSIRRERLHGHAVWRIVVHQRLANGRFDMRDEFVLDARTLRPVSLITTRNGKPHAALNYTEGRVTGYKMNEAGARVAVDQPLPGPIWDGNLFGPTFAALPLKAGARFTLPIYQYDRGVGAFTVTVKGSEQVVTPTGEVEAWVLDAGLSDTERLEYLVAKNDGRELGYRSPQGGQRLGGDCTGPLA